MIERASRRDAISPARSRWARWNEALEDDDPTASLMAPADSPAAIDAEFVNLIGLDLRVSASSATFDRIALSDVAATAQVSWRVAAGQSLTEAAQGVVDEIGALGGDGGLIALDRRGNIAQPYNSQGMKRAWLTTGGEIGVEVFGR